MPSVPERLQISPMCTGQCSLLAYSFGDRTYIQLEKKHEEKKSKTDSLSSKVVEWTNHSKLYLLLQDYQSEQPSATICISCVAN